MSRSEGGRLSNLSITIIGALVVALLSGTGYWVTWGSELITEPKVIELIETRSPYLIDRKLLLDQKLRLEDLDKSLDELKLEVRELKTMLRLVLEVDSGPPDPNGVN